MAKPKRVLVCGSRTWTRLEPIVRELRRHNAYVVIHGGAKGADTLAGKAAEILAIDTEMFPANWLVYGRAAGPIRNQQMLDVGRPDLVLAFHEDIDESKGTADMVEKARGVVPVEVHRE